MFSLPATTTRTAPVELTLDQITMLLTALKGWTDSAEAACHGEAQPIIAPLLAEARVLRDRLGAAGEALRADPGKTL